MSHGVETMAYVLAEGTPWHGIGTPVEGFMKADTVLRKAGADFEVELGDLYSRQGEGQWYKFPDRHSIYRTDTGAPLGVCKGTYRPIQNADSIRFMEDLVQAKVGLKFDTCAVLFGGRKVFALAKLDEDMETVSGDKHLRYLLGIWGHDRETALQAKLVITRVVCNNTLQMALQENGRSVHIAHSASAPAQMEFAKKIIGITTEQSRAYALSMQKLAAKRQTRLQLEAMMLELFGELDADTPRQTKDARGEFESVHQEEIAAFGQNYYSAVNAITGYADHKLVTRVGQRSQRERQEMRFISALDGQAAKFKSKGLAIVAELSGVKIAA